MRYLKFILTLVLVTLAVPATASAAPKVPKSFYGISTVNPTAQDFQDIGDVGIGAARLEINWRIIQRGRKGGYDWGYVDQRMGEMAAAGVQPAPLLFGTPRFVRKSPNGLYPPTNSKKNLKEWKQFLRAAAKRYGRGGDFWAANPSLPAAPVRSWIIWNEQNARPFWRPKPNPRDYAKLVKASDQALSSVDRKAKIVLGGIYGYPKDKRSFSAVKFLAKLYKVKKIEKHFDAITVHPYGGGVGDLRKQIKQARSAVRKAGDRKVGILVGEIGWASKGPKKKEEVVGAKGQAKRLKKGLKLLVKKRKAWHITGAYIYLWRDFNAETACLWCPRAGLVERDGDPKPALRAVRGVIRSTTR